MKKYNQILANEIVDTVIEKTGIDVRKKTRKQEYVYLRFVCFHFLKKKRPLITLHEIGKSLNVNHATVVHGLRMYDKLIRYPDFRELDETVEKAIKIFPEPKNKYCNPSIYLKNAQI